MAVGFVSLLQGRLMVASLVSLLISMLVTGAITFATVFFLLADDFSLEALVSFNVSIWSVPFFFMTFSVIFYLIMKTCTQRFVKSQLVEPLNDLTEAIKEVRFDQYEAFPENDYKVQEVALIQQALVNHLKEFRTMYDKFDALMITEHTTGLLRRSLLNDSLRHEVFLSERYNRPFSILAVRLKELCNKEKTPEENLTAFTKTLLQVTRNADMAFYINDHLFLVVAPETDLAGIRRMAAELVTRVRKQGEELGLDHCRFEVGWATYGDEDGTRPNDLLHTANRRLHDPLADNSKSNLEL